MTKTVNLNIEDHKLLKTYSKTHNLPMNEILGGLIGYITLNKIHPNEYLNENGGNLFSAEKKIIAEIRKNRNTYVSFQRTFEKKFDKDVHLIKEFQVYNLKRVLTASVKGSQKEKSMHTILQFFLVMLVESEIVGYNIQNESIPKMYSKAATKLQKEGTYYMSDIQKVANLIIKNYGILPNTKQSKLDKN